MEDAELIQLIRNSGETWLLRVHRTAEQSARHVRGLLMQAYAVYGEKFANPMPGEPAFDDETIREEATQNPHRIRALFQAVGSSSPAMIALVWRVIQGDTIGAIELKYRYEQSFEMRVSVENPLSGRAQSFLFEAIEDATFFRHLGIMRDGNAPLFDGYYALNHSGD